MNRILQSLLFCVLVFASCKNNQNQGESKTYNIPEIDKLSVEIAKSPKNAALYAARSTLFSENDLMKEAEIDAEKALALDSSKVDYYRLLANTYFDNNHSHPAIKTLEKAIERFPKEYTLYLTLAEMQHVIEQYQESLTTIDKLFKLQPNHPEGLFLQGLILKETGDTLKAIDRFQTAVEQDADHINAYIQLAILSNSMNNPITLRYLENALRIDSTNETALLTKAQYYHFRSEYEEAKKQYEYAILKHPQNSDFNYNLALMYLEIGDIAEKKGDKTTAQSNYESARRHFDNSTKFDVQFADAYYYKGIAAERLGKYKIAKTDFENALRLQSFLATVNPETVEDAIKRVEKK